MASTVNFGTQRNFGFDPRTIPGCQLWLDAADSNTFTFSSSSNISTWKDKSINALTGTATNSPTQTASSINGLPAVVFSTGTQYIDYGNNLNLGTNSISIFSVVKYDSTANGAIVGKSSSAGGNAGRWSLLRNSAEAGLEFIFDTGSATTNTGYADTSTTPQLVSTVWDRSNTFIFQNGTQKATNVLANASSYSTTYLLWVGAYQNATGGAPPTAGLYLIGKIGEIIIYIGTPLSTLQRQQVEGYLAWKWGLQASLPVGHGFQTKPTTMRAFQPTDLSNCILWLDGADASKVGVSGANVTAWNDKSGLGNNLTTISATPPTYSSTTGAITFTSQNLTAIRGALTGGPYSNPISTFVVCSITSNANAIYTPRLVMFGTNGTSSTLFAGQTNFVLNASTGTTPAFITYANNGLNPTTQGVNIQTYVPTTFSTIGIFENLSTYSGTTLTNNTFLNGNTSTYSAVNTTWTVAAPYVTSMAYVSLGNYTDGSAVAGDCFSGNIYEVIVFSRTLTTSERQQIEGYLASKWNVSSLLPTTQPYYLNRALPSTSI